MIVFIIQLMNAILLNITYAIQTKRKKNFTIKRAHSTRFCNKGVPILVREMNAGIGFAGLYGAAWSFGFEFGLNCKCGPFNYFYGTGAYAK